MIIVRQGTFSKVEKENEKKKKSRIKLSDIESHRGLGRSYLLGHIPGAIGGYVSKGVADDADAEGLSDKEITKKASKAGALVGGGTGTALGLAGGLKSAEVLRRHGALNNKYAKAAWIAGSTIASGAGGALGGYMGAKKNAKTRLNKRAQMEKNREE